MDNLSRLGNQISIPITPDESNFTGRECPNPECIGYFKIESGTGLKGDDLPCHCPYCGHRSSHDNFWTKEQIEYVKSVAMRRITDAFHKDMKKLEFELKPTGSFGIGLSMKVKSGPPVPIRYYRENSLETEIVCNNCTLRYAVYGVFAFCPDCGQHNSTHILKKNLELVQKMLILASKSESDLAKHLIENSLEDCVSAFDGFARKLCHIHAEKSPSLSKSKKISFQNLDGSRRNLNLCFGIHLGNSLTEEEWTMAIQCFQKRHLISHSMGIVDEQYIQKSGDTNAIVGRRISITADEVNMLIPIVEKLGTEMFVALDRL